MKRIELSKKLFAIDIEQNNECIIPEILMQNKLPISFRYYDPIIKIVKARMSKEKTEMFNAQRIFEREMYIESLADRMKDAFGFGHEEHENKPKLKQVPINKRRRTDIEIHMNQQTKQI